MPKKALTPVAVRGAAPRRKGALTRTPTPPHVRIGGTVESVESTLASARYGGLWALTELIDGFKIRFLTPL